MSIDEGTFTGNGTINGVAMNSLPLSQLDSYIFMKGLLESDGLVCTLVKVTMTADLTLGTINWGMVSGVGIVITVPSGITLTVAFAIGTNYEDEESATLVVKGTL